MEKTILVKALKKVTSTFKFLKVTINIDNAAFKDDYSGEMARIFENLAKQFKEGKRNPVILDINGNRVGKVEIVK